MTDGVGYQFPRFDADAFTYNRAKWVGELVMFGFRKGKPAPPKCPANPGIASEGKLAFSTGDRSWTEAVNLVSIAAKVLKSRGHSVTSQKTWLLHSGSGFMILPLLLEVHPLDDGGVQTVTTIQTNHPAILSDGVFEYQHSTGNSIADSISTGFDQWLQTDFVSLLDALRPKAETCMTLELSFPARDGKPERHRRAVLGPVAHFRQEPLEIAEDGASEEHPFCPCCLLTNSFKAFSDFIESDGFYGLRLFAARDTEGVSQADCRVNGEDWEEGAHALREYAGTWPAAGYEFRKQYVVLQSVNKGSPGESLDDRNRD
jgi:hypothetical protein